jgi:glycosyltransferase involved in cell wall biosynthesis
VFPPYIKRVYDEHPFDILRAHSVRFVGPACLWVQRHYRLPVPVVVHHHHLDPDPLNGLIERPVLFGADLIVTDSEFSRRQLLEEMQVPAEKVGVVYCGIGPQFVPQPRDEALLAHLGLTGKQVLLSLGLLIPRKNLGFLLKVFAHVVARCGNRVRLVLAGSGPEEARLRKQARALGVAGQVVFTGYVPEADKVRYYNLADVFVQTSKLEGFGLVVAEAMACGVPVVVSRVGSLPEVVADGVTGYLCELDDVGTFAASIMRLLDDDSLRHQMGQAAQVQARQRFDWDEAARSVGVLYENLKRTGYRTARLMPKR